MDFLELQSYKMARGQARKQVYTPPELKAVEERIATEKYWNEDRSPMQELINKQLKQLVRKQDEIFLKQFNIVTGNNLTEKQMLFLDKKDFSADVYDYDPGWTHYYYKGQRIISIGPAEYSDTKQDENGYTMNISQKYY